MAIGYRQTQRMIDRNRRIAGQASGSLYSIDRAGPPYSRLRPSHRRGRDRVKRSNSPPETDVPVARVPSTIATVDVEPSTKCSGSERM